MLVHIQVSLHTIPSHDMWGLRELNNDEIKLRPRILPVQIKFTPKKNFKMTRYRCLVTHCKIYMCNCV